jgi:hypothetical protein
MGVSVRGHSDLHLHSPCPQCGYATRYKQWPITCACSNAQRQKIRTTPAPHVVEIWAEQERKNAELHQINHRHIGPLRTAERYAAGRPGALRRGPCDANPHSPGT